MVPLETLCTIDQDLFSSSSKSRFVNSDVFSASRNFKFVVIFRSGVCALRLVCLQDIKNTKDGQEHVYHSVHMPTFECNTQWLTQTGAHAVATRDCAPPVQACLKIIRVKCTVVNH